MILAIGYQRAWTWYWFVILFVANSNRPTIWMCKQKYFDFSVIRSVWVLNAQVIEQSPERDKEREVGVYNKKITKQPPTTNVRNIYHCTEIQTLDGNRSLWTSNIVTTSKADGASFLALDTDTVSSRNWHLLLTLHLKQFDKLILWYCAEKCEKSSETWVIYNEMNAVRIVQ